jgi:hypothetical protein
MGEFAPGPQIHYASKLVAGDIINRLGISNLALRGLNVHGAGGSSNGDFNAAIDVGFCWRNWL